MKLLPSRQALRYLRSALSAQPYRSHPRDPFLLAARHFHATWPRDRIETHVLSDIGEGVKEVQIIQWFVEEGAAIEEWSPLCEVQSDKASVEITSKFTGVIKKIHFDRDAVVQVGDAMLDIEVEGEGDAEPEEPETQKKDDVADEQQAAEGGTASAAEAASTEHTEAKKEEAPASREPPPTPPPKGKHASLATPAVRGLLKEHNINIEDIDGTGRDGRVLKEDVYKYLDNKMTSTTSSTAPPPSKPSLDSKQTETPQRLTPIQSAMFKTMTGSLKIPHFLYSDTIDITTLSSMRKRLNETRDPDSPKLSYLPFMIKAISLALNKYPLLNARIDTTGDKPQLIMRSNHNIGVAMDTPSGLIVPVMKSVNSRSILSIAEDLQRLSKLGQAGKLTNEDLTGGTITISNIGNIGGEVVAPVIVEGQLAIMGVGKIRAVPAFGEDGGIKRAEMVTLSWSADHRVVDGATMARVASVVQGYLEEPGRMVVGMS